MKPLGGWFQPWATTGQPPPSRPLVGWLLGAFLLALLPHLVVLPIWTTLGVIACLSWRVARELGRVALPSAGFCALLALCLIVAVLVRYQSVLGREPGTVLTAGLLAIKFLELRTLREITLVAYASFFLVMSSLLFLQTLEIFLFCVVLFWLLAAVLLRAHAGDRREQTLLFALTQAGRSYLLILPLALLLFFFFPRYGGRVALFFDRSSIGFSETVRPGSVASLANDESTAFRVRFPVGDLPNPSTMYWRGAVLWNYEHGTWSPGPTRPSGREPVALPLPGTHVIGQAITLLPQRQPWLFALDVPARPPVSSAFGARGCVLTREGTLRLIDPSAFTRLLAYTVFSAPQLRSPGSLTAEEERLGLDLPAHELSPEIKALAVTLQQGCRDARDYSLAILRYFRREHFVYTSTPGRMADSLDEFLFRRKAGFCEHYASAYAVLMRLGDSRRHSPVRLVAGYLGGVYNPYGNFFTVRQSQAHAWVEVWREDEKRWARVDPTAAISGEGRSPATADSSPLGGESDQALTGVNSGVGAGAMRPSANWLRRGLAEWGLRRDEIEAEWESLVTSYDAEAAERLRDWLGTRFGQAPRSLLLGAGLAAAGLALFAGLIFARHRAPQPERLYARFCRQMARRGAARESWEAPLAYTERVALLWPESAGAIRTFGRTLADWRYAPNRDVEAGPKLARLWSEIRRGSRAPAGKTFPANEKINSLRRPEGTAKIGGP